MSFENPVWLAVTPLMVLTIAGLVAFGLRRRDTLICQFIAARLLNQLTEKVSLKRSLIKAFMILLAVALIGVALARPQYGVDFVERKARGLDIVFVLDSSKSMLATDLRPTRLERAKLAIADLMKRLESDRIGLVVFSGNAFLQTPPTLDYSAFRENLNAVGTSSISRGGSNIGQALREAAKAFPKDDNFKVVVLLTDGEDLEEQAIDTAREIAEDGIRVYSIGIGTPEGTYLKVRLENGVEEYVRDSSGQPVRSRLDETTLRKISKLTGGSYSRLAGQSLETLYTSVLATLPRQERESKLQESRIERYQWPLFAAVIFLVMEVLIRRRRRINTHSVALFLCLHLIIPTPSSADETDSIPDQTTEETTTFEKPSTDPRIIYNQAHESLLKGNYVEAKDLYEKAIQGSDDITLERDGLYNMAHAMNQMGEEALQSQDFQTAVDYWKQAEELFKSANELDPDDADSLEDAELMASRRKALEDFLEQQQSQEQEQSMDENSGDQDPQDSETDSSESESDNSESSSEENSDASGNTESSESSAEQESSKNQEEDDASQSSSDTKDDESDASEQTDDSTKSSEAADSEETTDDSSAESDKDPTEDMQQSDATTGSDQDDNSSESEKDAVTQNNSADRNGTTEGQETVTVSEGMQLLEAQALLNSLRNDEQLLPYTGPAEEQGSSRKERDW